MRFTAEVRIPVGCIAAALERACGWDRACPTRPASAVLAEHYRARAGLCPQWLGWRRALSKRAGSSTLQS